MARVKRLLACWLVLVLTVEPALAATLPGWLSGCWERRADGFLYEEYWMQPAAGVMLGVSRTVVDGRLAGTEYLRIDVNERGEMRYVASPSNQAVTVFSLVMASADRLVFENLEHDFPQRIIYSRAGKRLLARHAANRVREGRPGERAATKVHRRNFENALRVLPSICATPCLRLALQ